MKYRKYIKPVLEDPERLDTIHVPPERTVRYRVHAVRRVSPGAILIFVDAPSEAEAIRRVEAGEVTTIGLGWRVATIELDPG